MDGTEIGVLKERHKISFDGLLKSTDGGRLEAKIRLEVLSNFTNKTLERQLADQKLSGFLVATNFTESDGTLMLLVLHSHKLDQSTIILPGL